MSKLLRELAVVHYGKSQAGVASVDGDVPILGTGGQFGKATRGLFSGPAVVVPRKGSLGNPQYVEGPFWPVDTTYAVIPKNGVLARWIYYSLDHYGLTKLNEATGVPSINRDLLERVRLGAIPLHQQCRIAEILSAVDEAIERTEQLIAKQRKIKAGLMTDLFTRGVWTAESLAKAQAEGNATATAKVGRLRPTRQAAPGLYKESPLGWIPREWEVRELGEMVPHAVYGISETLHNAGIIPILRMNNIKDGEIVIDDLKYFNGEVQYALILKEGDVLYNRTNSLEHVGKTAIWRGQLRLASFASYLVRLETDSNQMLPEYLNIWMNWEATQNTIRSFARPNSKRV